MGIGTENRLHIYKRPWRTPAGSDPDANRLAGLHSTVVVSFLTSPNESARQALHSINSQGGRVAYQSRVVFSASQAWRQATRPNQATLSPAASTTSSAPAAANRPLISVSFFSTTSRVLRL